jgi:hypothetical protein
LADDGRGLPLIDGKFITAVTAASWATQQSANAGCCAQQWSYKEQQQSGVSHLSGKMADLLKELVIGMQAANQCRCSSASP